MNIFRSYTYTWQQIGIFKLALFAIGVAVGAYWHVFFGAHLVALLTIGVIATIYTVIVSLRQL